MERHYGNTRERKRMKKLRHRKEKGIHSQQLTLPVSSSHHKSSHQDSPKSSHDPSQDTEQLTSNEAENTYRHHLENKPLFPVFNGCRKKIHLVRHGHTTYREGYFMTADGKHPFDVTLSPMGIQQAIALGQRLNHLNAELILTSPLTRALQTLQHAVSNIKIAEPTKIEVSSLHTEHVCNSSDVGRPPKILAEEFSWLSFASLKDTWWYSPDDAPNDPLKGIFQSRESYDNLRRRVGIFRRFLLSRAEQIIVVIGHSTFFKEFSGKKRRMQNCEVLTVLV